MNHEPYRTYSKNVEAIKNLCITAIGISKMLNICFCFSAPEKGVKHSVMDAMLLYCH